MEPKLPRDRFIGVKLTAVEFLDLARAARKTSISEFVRQAVATAIAERRRDAGR